VTLRNRIDGLFEAWGRLVYARRYLVLSLCMLAVATAATFLPHLESENSTESYLRGGDSVSIGYKDFQRTFGQDDRLMIAIESPAIFSFEFLERLRALHEAAESELPDVAKVTSLINIRETRGVDDALVVADLTEEWPETEADLARLRERVFANPLYADNVISSDALVTTVTIEPVVYEGGDEDAEAALAGFDDTGENRAEVTDRVFLPEARKGALVEALSLLLESHEEPGFRLHMVGSAVVAHYITKAMTSDTMMNVSVTALSIVAFLFLLFRRISGVVFPMLVVIATLILELGVMVWLGIPFSITLGMIPVFTMCVGVCCTVHILVLTYQQRATGANSEESIAYAFNHSGLAIFMTSLTTACGMMSFLTADLEPVRHMGVVAPIGVGFAFVMTMTLLPAMLAIFPLREKARIGASLDQSFTQQGLMRVGDLAVRRPWSVVGVAAALALFFVVGLVNARFSHEPLKWMPADDPVRVATELVDARLGGANTAEVVIDTGRENGLHDPEMLQRLDAAITRAEAIEHGPVFVGKAVSLVDIVKETPQALNSNDSDFYAIPDDRQLVAQELLLFENSGNEDLEDITDTRFQRARVTLRVPLVDAVLYDEFLQDVRAAFSGVSDQPVVLTGRSAISSRTFAALIESMAASYLVALAVITPLMMALIGNVRLGLISMVPNLFPVLAVLGVMGWLGLPLDASSIMIGSIIISLAVDDTIHFMHRFRLDFERLGDTRAAVRETLRTTGSALLFTSLVLATGFSVMGALGTMQNTVVFGAMSAMGICFAFISDALITPALIQLSTPSKRVSAEAQASNVGSLAGSP
jgi:predicted RND superfamily exporter protein